MQLIFEVPRLQNNRLLREYYKARGCTTKANLVIIPSRCPHLNKDNLCDIHNTKPILCKIDRGRSEKYYRPEGCGFQKTL